MTTGEFRSIPIASITANRSERQRSKLDGVDTIAPQTRRLYQSSPRYSRSVLVCGEQRLEAAKQNGYTAVTCQYTDVTDPLELRVIELEENRTAL